MNKLIFLISLTFCLKISSGLAGGSEIDFTKVSIAPNPFTDSILVSNLPEGKKVILVENEYGQIVQAYYIKEKQYTIAEEDLTPGVYLLKIELNGDIKTFRIIKRKV